MRQREDWWEYTKRIIRSYPALERKRKAEDTLTEKEQRRYDAVRAAIGETERMPTGLGVLEAVAYIVWGCNADTDQRAHSAEMECTVYSDDRKIFGFAVKCAGWIPKNKISSWCKVQYAATSRRARVKHRPQAPYT